MQSRPVDLGKLSRAARMNLDEAKSAIGEVADTVQDEAVKAGRTLSDVAMDELDRRVALLGQNGRQVADTLRSASGDLQGPGSHMVGHLADTLDDLSYRLENRSARELADDLTQLGRDHPTAFMLGCLVTGVVVGRLIAMAPASYSDDVNQQYSAGADPQEPDRPDFWSAPSEPRMGRESDA